MKKNGRVVNKNALLHNVKQIKMACGNAKLCAMVKADAYGHGAKGVVEALSCCIDFFGVADFYEAKQIREYNKKAKILVVGKTCIQDMMYASEGNISISVSHLDELKQINHAIKNKPLCVHIKVNSGMNRLGCDLIDEYILMQKYIKKHKNIVFEGIFTHFCSINTDKKYFDRQKRIFEKFVSATYNEFNPIVHVGGSEVLNEKFDYRIDMIRVGLNIYGYSIQNKMPNLKKVMSIYSKILDIKEIQACDITGYAPYVLEKRNRKIATVFYGYADGIQKQLVNKIRVRIKGMECDILAVCMDMFICDISGVNARVGDEVLILESFEEWATLLCSSVYEIMVSFRHLRK